MHGSPGIYLSVEENLGKPQLVNHLMKIRDTLLPSEVGKIVEYDREGGIQKKERRDQTKD